MLVFHNYEGKMESRLTHLLLKAICGWNLQFQVVFQPRLDNTYPLLIVSPKCTIGSTESHECTCLVHMYALGDGDTRMGLICSPHKAIHLVQISSLRIGMMT